jgi:DNA repair exonuclease SbcCD ATPase subunit
LRLAQPKREEDKDEKKTVKEE